MSSPVLLVQHHHLPLAASASLTGHVPISFFRFCWLGLTTSRCLASHFSGKVLSEAGLWGPGQRGRAEGTLVSTNAPHSALALYDGGCLLSPCGEPPEQSPGLFLIHPEVAL